MYYKLYIIYISIYVRNFVLLLDVLWGSLPRKEFWRGVLALLRREKKKDEI